MQGPRGNFSYNCDTRYPGVDGAMGLRSSCAHVWVEVPLAEAGSGEGLLLTLCLWLTSQLVVEGAGARVWEPRLRYAERADGSEVQF